LLTDLQALFTPRETLRALAPISLLVLTGAVAFVSGTASCGDSAATTNPASGPVGPATTSTGGGGEGGAGGTSDLGGDPRAIFEETLEGDLLSECGACHQLQGAADAPFLAEPDRYVSITSYPGIVVSKVDDSILLTRPADPGHGSGQAPDFSPGLREKVQAWLGIESVLIPEPEELGFVVTPFKPKLGGAFNTIYLDELGQEFTNVSVTFNATELGAPPSMLLLENIQVHPVAEMQLHVVHPLFTAYPSDTVAIPDPSDSFSQIDDVFSLDGAIQLGTGTMIHTAWAKDGYLSLAFEDLYLVGDFFPPTDCEALDLFSEDVAPALGVCATNCHGGANPQAQGAMDLADLGSDDAKACRQVRARVKPGAPDLSQIFIVTNPLDPAAHLFKFSGSSSNFNTFKQTVSPWVIAEGN
jgi:hypothetical protein